MKLSIVVPCYDEAQNIPLILERFSEVITRDDVEVVLVEMVLEIIHRRY